MRILLIFCIIVIILCLSKSELYSADNIFTNYTKLNGLVSNFVRAIDIDKQSNKWIGTDSGVSKLNLNSCKNYTVLDGLPSNNISDIAIDSQNNIWFGTLGGGVSKFDGSLFKTYDTSDGLINNWVYKIEIDKQGTKWICTDGGVSKLQDSIWTNYTKTDGLASNEVYTMAFDCHGNKWFGTTNNGVSKFDDNLWTTYNIDDGLPGVFISAIAVDPQDNKWFGTISSCTYGCDWVLTKLSETGWHNFAAPDTSKVGTNVNFIFIDKDGKKWIGTDRFKAFEQHTPKGLTIFNDTNWTTFTIEDGLANNSVLRMAVDSNGNKWFATTGGVSCLGNVSIKNGLKQKYPSLNISIKQAFGTSNHSVALEYFIPKPLPFKISVLTLSGKTIAVLYSGTQQAGKHLIKWDGGISSFLKACSGFYIAKMESNNIYVLCNILYLQ